MTLSAFQVLLYSAFLLFPPLGAGLGYALSRRYPHKRVALILGSVVVLGAAMASAWLGLVYPGPLVRPPGSLPWLLGALSFFCVTVPFWVATSVFHLPPLTWPRTRWALSILAGYASVFPAIFLVLIAACGYAGACL